MQNLGVITKPLLVFGGACSNRQATEAMQRAAEQHEIPPRRIISTGDAVAYCAEPEATVQLLRDWGIHSLMGNCEEALAEEADDCGCGFEQGSTCDVLTNTWYPFALRNLSAASKVWMKTLPRHIRFAMQGRQFLVVHGGVSQINRFIFHSTSREDKREEIESAGVDGVIGGHCGMPFGETVDDKVWLNSGAIGMPANDGSHDGWYMIMEPVAGEQIRVHWHRLKYDACESYSAMQRQGLNNGYAEALLTGLWPSMDVLPEAEQKQRGIAISLDELRF